MHRPINLGHPKPVQRKDPTISLDTIGARYALVDPQTIMIERHLHYKRPKINIDVFGRGWVYFTTQNNHGQLSFKLGNGRIVELPSGNIAGYIPAFSVIECHLKPGTITIEMFTRIKMPQFDVPPYPVIFCDTKPLPAIESWQHFLKHGIPDERISINRVSNNCALSARTFRYFIEHYRDLISLQDFAHKLNTSSAVLSRYFKKSYGISPLKLLNQMRIMNSLGDFFWEKKSITDASMNLGYSDVRIFYENFSKILKNRPSCFKSCKRYN